MIEQADVLAFGAHPDDVEIGVGGLLIRAADQGLSVALCDLTAGERGTRGTQDQRRSEASAAAEVLGAQFRFCLDLPDAELVDAPHTRRRVAEVIRKVRPRYLLGPFELDLHPDHQAAARLVKAACFLSGLRGHEGLDGLAHRPDFRWAYPGLPGRDTPEATASQVVDVSCAHERKLRAVRCHASQFAGPESEEDTWRAGGPRPLDRLIARDGFFGAQIGVRFGEPLVSDGPTELRIEALARPFLRTP